MTQSLIEKAEEGWNIRKQAGNTAGIQRKKPFVMCCSLQ